MRGRFQMGRLTPDVGPGDHVQGAPDAKVTLVQYGDYECPFCGAAYPVVKQVQEWAGADLRFVFRNFPLTMSHPHAQHAAEAAEAAAAQGRFWEMHDFLYEHQKALDDASLIQHAGKVGLDVDRFRREMAAHSYADRVRQDVQSGMRSGVNGTPTFFINGVRHDGPHDFKTLSSAIKKAGAKGQ